MKVLQVINSLGTGGAEKLLLETVPLFREKGVEMDVLVLNGADSPFLRKLREMNCCKIFSLGKGGVYNPFLALQMIPHFKRYDVVHVHLFPSLYWAAIAKMLALGKFKLVYTEHSTGNNRRSKPLAKFADRFFYSRYDKIVCISEEVKQILIDFLKTKSSRFAVIQSGVNIQKIFDEKPYDSEQFPIKAVNFVLIQVSSFHYPKDQKTVIRALPLLPENVVLVLVGNGPTLEKNKKLADELGVSHRVEFIGVRMDVPQLLKSSDAVLLSSEFEGVSLSSIEGLASGKPFLATDVPGLGEIVGGAGILFPLGDENRLASEIQKLIEDQQHYSDTVSRCIGRAKEFNIDLMIDKHIELYHNLTAQ